MSKLCLENIQFLNEDNLDGFDFILDEFANEYNYLESINEASISDTISKAIDKLKELWKSFIEGIRNAIRKIKIKAMQMLAKLKLKGKEEQKKESEYDNSSNSSENETKEMIMNIPEIFSDIDDEGSLTAEFSIVLSVIYNNGFKKCIQCIKENIENAIKDKDKHYKYVFTGDEFKTLMKLFEGSVVKMDKSDEKESIYDTIKYKFVGDNIKTKISFNNKNGIAIKRALDSMVSYLNKFENDVDRLETEGSRYIKTWATEIYDSEDRSIYIDASLDLKFIMSIINKSTNALLRCHVSIINALYTLVNESRYVYNYATFTKA